MTSSRRDALRPVVVLASVALVLAAGGVPSATAVGPSVSGEAGATGTDAETANGTGASSATDANATADWDAVGVPPPAEHAWRRTVGGPLFDGFAAAEALPGGGLALAGRSDGRVGSDRSPRERPWLVVTDAEGEVSVNRTYPSSGRRAVDVAVRDATFGASTGGSGSVDYLLLATDSTRATGRMARLSRLDGAGDPLWTTNLTVAGGRSDLDPVAVTRTARGSLVLGQVLDADGLRPFLALIDDGGEVVWRRQYDRGLEPVDVAPVEDGFVLACDDWPSATDSVLLAVGREGTLRWRRATPGGTGSLGAVVPGPDGTGAVAVGEEMSSALAVDSAGETRWRRTYDVPPPNLSVPVPEHYPPPPRLTAAFGTDEGLVLAGSVDLPGDDLGRRPIALRVGPDGRAWHVEVRSSPVHRVAGAARARDGGLAFVGESPTRDGAVDRLGPVASDGTPAPADRDGDGAYEDVNGDGATDVADVRRLADLLGLAGVSGLAGPEPTFPPLGSRTVDGERARTLASAFDVTGDGRADVRDVRSLYESLPVRYETVVFDGLPAATPVVEGGLGGRGDAGRYVTTVTDRRGLDRFDHARLGPTASRFVNETEFDRSFLVVYQAFPDSSSPDRVVAGAVRNEGTLALMVSEVTTLSTGDSTVETLLVRVHVDGREPPERVRVREHGGDGCQERLVAESSPGDLDCDGRFADVNGDGRLGVGDVVALFARLDDDAVRTRPERFDFTGDGRVGVGDVVALFEDVSA